ncbi:hypothetical protein CK203_073417 [Vitis vinifera]|uniref:Reverse transcriptase zinc-binding domain-containing protein n=1 Tax=Vitis vinifera TaxID=29760 RepID=A0A438ESB1_VITVI|nr:hypothetical protein CK203_073417 [Vitis vinifera]
MPASLQANTRLMGPLWKSFSAQLGIMTREDGSLATGHYHGIMCLPTSQTSASLPHSQSQVYNHNQMGNDIHCALPELTLPFQWLISARACSYPLFPMTLPTPEKTNGQENTRVTTMFMHFFAPDIPKVLHQAPLAVLILGEQVSLQVLSPFRMFPSERSSSHQELNFSDGATARGWLGVYREAQVFKPVKGSLPKNKASFFGWEAAWSRLLTTDHLKRFGWSIPNSAMGDALLCEKKPPGLA